MSTVQSPPRLSPGARAAREAAARQDVHSVTTARKSLAEDQAQRTRQYLISMAIRTACFILGVITPSPWRWLFFAGAAFLPYIAVVFANAVNVHPAGEVEAVDAGALPAAPGMLLLEDGTPVEGPHEAPTPTGAWAATADGYVEPDVARDGDVHVGEVIASRVHRPDDTPQHSRHDTPQHSPHDDPQDGPAA